jgi:hypothetical protein
MIPPVARCLLAIDARTTSRLRAATYAAVSCSLVEHTGVPDPHCVNVSPRLCIKQYLSATLKSGKMSVSQNVHKPLFAQHALSVSKPFATSAVDPLSNPEKGGLPSKQEKVAAAENAAVGQNDPPESSFDSISAAYTSKLNRPAMRATYREHIDYVSLPAWPERGFRDDFRFGAATLRPFACRLIWSSVKVTVYFCSPSLGALRSPWHRNGSSWTRMPCFLVRARWARTAHAVRV